MPFLDLLMFPSFCHICLHLIPSNRFVNLRPLVRQTSSPLIFNTSLRFLLHLLITLGFLPTRQKSWETADVLYPDSRWTCLPPYVSCHMDLGYFRNADTRI